MGAVVPTYNEHPDFVGYAEIDRRQADTLHMFTEAARAREWQHIHHAHYDWWMFPIDQPSRLGFDWTVYDGDIEHLRARAGFVDRYLEGVRILMVSWGWDLAARRLVDHPDSDQCWQDWPIRLEKCGRSLWLFGERDSCLSVRDFALGLMASRVSLAYSGRNCGDYFRDHE